MKNILIIEDEQMLAMLLARKVSNAGYQVYTAHDGDEAIDIVLKHKIDLFICDIMLPLVSGYSLAKVLGNKDEDTPFIMMSSLPNAEATLSKLDIKHKCFMKKPVDLEMLISKIQELI